jgi:hypothetical protein
MSGFAGSAMLCRFDCILLAGANPANYFLPISPALQEHKSLRRNINRAHPHLGR